MCCAANAPTRRATAVPPSGTPTTRWRSSTRISPGPSPPPSSVIRPAWRGTPRRRCRCCRPPGSYPTAAARLLRGLALAGQVRAAAVARATALLSELDELTRWLAARAADAPDELPAPAAAGRGRAGLGGRRLPRRRARLRRRPARGRRASAAVASGADHRTRGPLPPRPRRRARRLRPSRRRPPGVPRLGRDREGRPARLGLPDPATARRRDHREAATSPLICPSAPPSRPGRSTCSASCPRRRRSARRPASNGCTRAWPRCSAR